jgi:pantothenate kinase
MSLPILNNPTAHLLDLLEPGATSPKPTLIALAGLPGSGKSTLAEQLAKSVNAQAGAGTMMALGMDGFHLSKAQLAAFADPAAALLRRGAPWTFDAAGFLARVKALRLHDNQTRAALTWPGFEHGAGDPVADQFTVPAQTRIVIIEGLYLLHQGDGWGDSPDWADLFDERWFLDVGMDLAMQRLVARHMSANGQSREFALQRLAVNDRLNAQIVWQSRPNAQWLLNN